MRTVKRDVESLRQLVKHWKKMNQYSLVLHPQADLKPIVSVLMVWEDRITLYYGIEHIGLKHAFLTHDIKQKYYPWSVEGYFEGVLVNQDIADEEEAKRILEICHKKEAETEADEKELERIKECIRKANALVGFENVDD